MEKLLEDQSTLLKEIKTIISALERGNKKIETQLKKIDDNSLNSERSSSIKKLKDSKTFEEVPKTSGEDSENPKDQNETISIKVLNE